METWMIVKTQIRHQVEIALQGQAMGGLEACVKPVLRRVQIASGHVWTDGVKPRSSFIKPSELTTVERHVFPSTKRHQTFCTRLGHEYTEHWISTNYAFKFAFGICRAAD